MKNKIKQLRFRPLAHCRGKVQSSCYLEQPSHFPHRRPRAREEPGVEDPAAVTASPAATAVLDFASTLSAVVFLALLAGGGEGPLAPESPSVVVVLFAGGARPPLESNSAVVASALLSFWVPSFSAPFFLRVWAVAFTQIRTKVRAKAERSCILSWEVGNDGKVSKKL